MTHHKVSCKELRLSCFHKQKLRNEVWAEYKQFSSARGTGPELNILRVAVAYLSEYGAEDGPEINNLIEMIAVR